jgi:uncharacterized integral membrane protein
MSTDPSSSGSDEATASGKGTSSARRAPRITRASAAWVATAVALLLLILLIIFILENSTNVEVQFLGMSGTIPLGMALFIAAVGGGVVVAIAGVARVTQLRMNARRTRQSTSSD